MNDYETTNVARADTARQHLAEDLRAMSNLTRAVPSKSWPALLGIALVTLAASGAALLVVRAGRARRRGWDLPQPPSLLREVVRALALSVASAFAARLARAVPLALLPASTSRSPAR